MAEFISLLLASVLAQADAGGLPKPTAQFPVFDGHNDLAWVIREKFGNDLSKVDLRQTTALDTDIPKLRKGGIQTQFWSVYVPAEDPTLPTPAHAQLEQIDVALRFIEAHPDTFLFATEVADIAKAKATGKIASFLGMEGGHTIENSLALLRSFYALGVRSMTLTHNSTLDWADAALDVPRNRGLTLFGKEVVREMNRLGMIVDISHVSAQVMKDVLATTQSPALFTHSAAYALVPHPRNVPDDIFADIRRTRSVLMVTFVPAFVSKEAAADNLAERAALKGASNPKERKRREEAFRKKAGPRPRARLAQVVEHIVYLKEKLGTEFIGIGGDFYGAEPDQQVEGLEDASTYGNLFIALKEKGLTDDELMNISHRNAQRVLTEVERVAKQLRSERPASNVRIEDSVKSLKGVRP
jgi:membrane dipeptidase